MTALLFSWPGRSLSGRADEWPPVQLSLPLEPRDFVGRVWYCPARALDTNRFDRLVRLQGVQTLVDLRDTPVLGPARARHRARCASLARWEIAYLRLDGLLRRAEATGLAPFEVPGVLADLLQADAPRLEALREASGHGAILVLHPDHGPRLAHFQGACRHLDLNAFGQTSVPLLDGRFPGPVGEEKPQEAVGEAGA
ncbi:hypothetical protein [Pararhodospirillum oryzae]|uniref:Uncharacterized protein n=1 Tax=Pararhodospirillum oryzae TaxID=478448 RepID=A0A512H5A6_9PROT|nr:hypothetical protein [Pararhodospirillum oryzae]GEO80623.1 hypothetical protein ROR02_07540 [Pararhodospirillum oryzae]